jgi:hypothetical protein
MTVVLDVFNYSAPNGVAETSVASVQLGDTWEDVGTLIPFTDTTQHLINTFIIQRTFKILLFPQFLADFPLGSIANPGPWLSAMTGRWKTAMERRAPCEVNTEKITFA